MDEVRKKAKDNGFRSTAEFVRHVLLNEKPKGIKR
jgi:hypothetical protein